MKRIIGFGCVLAIMAMMFAGCPPGAPKFKIRVDNDSTGGENVTSIRAIKFNNGNFSITSENLLSPVLAPGATREISVPLSSVGDGTGIYVAAGGSSLAQGIQGGLVNGLIIDVHITGTSDIEITAEL